MARYRFAPEVGEAPPGGAGLRADVLQGLLLARGLPAERLRIVVDGAMVTLEGPVPDAEAAERILLVTGNLRGVAGVEDRMAPARGAGLLGALAGLAEFPAGAANMGAAEGALRRADDDPPDPDQAYGPGGSLLHKVQEGESLEGIAQRHFGMTRDAWRLREANGGILPASGHGPPPGTVLRLPRPGSRSAAWPEGPAR